MAIEEAELLSILKLKIPKLSVDCPILIERLWLHVCVTVSIYLLQWIKQGQDQNDLLFFGLYN